MKTIQKIFLLSILTGGVVIGSSFNTIAQNSSTGVFNTYQDYLQHNLTPYSELTLEHGGFKGVCDGKKIRSPYKNASFWGIEDADGIVYRINKQANTADQIVLSGKIFYYAGMEVELHKKGNVADETKETINIKAESGVKFSDLVWVSQEGDGTMLGASKENVSKLLADSPDLVSEVQNIDETNADNWVDTFGTIRTIIGRYNKTHK